MEFFLDICFCLFVVVLAVVLFRIHPGQNIICSTKDRVAMTPAVELIARTISF